MAAKTGSAPGSELLVIRKQAGVGGSRLFWLSGSVPFSPQEYPLAALGGTSCHCGFPTTLFSLHEREDEQLCAQKCGGEEFESCGSAEYFIVYQTQVQGTESRVALLFQHGAMTRGTQSAAAQLEFD